MTREEEIEQVAMDARQIAASQMYEGVYSIDEIPNVTEALLFDEIYESAFKLGAEWADKHPQKSNSMFTDGLLERLPSEIHSENFEMYSIINKFDNCGKLKLFYYDGQWVAWYENGLGGVIRLISPNKIDSTYAVGYGDTPREALQELYDWCVENDFIESQK